MKKSNTKENGLNLELDENLAQGTYSNLALITHSNSDFIIDFIRMVPGVEKAKVKSRIIMTPQHAKRLLGALQDNIQKFEANFGEIKDTGGQVGLPMSLGPNAKA